MRPGFPCEVNGSKKYSTVFLRVCPEDDGDNSTGGIADSLLRNDV
jgi:hypothetical protein